MSIRQKFQDLHIPDAYLSFLQFGGKLPNKEFLLDTGSRYFIEDYPRTLEAVEEWYKEHIEESPKGAIIIAEYDSGFYLLCCEGTHRGRVFHLDDDARKITLLHENFTEFLGILERGTSPPKAIAEVFASLEEKGIVARADFSCCGTCGGYEIWEEVKKYEAEGCVARGYVFYHMQDTESLMEFGNLYMSYGAQSKEENAMVEIGHEIVAEFQAHQVAVEWSGNIYQRILAKQIPREW